MNSFEWASPTTVEEAVKLLSDSRSDGNLDEMPRAMSGGQDLLTTMKDAILRPPRVVNLKLIGGLSGVSSSGNELTIGSLVTISDLVDNAEVKKTYPGLAEAAHSVATLQIRNLGTVGGNLCQRPRCWYYRLENVICLKKGGSTCYAADGENKYHAIFGGGPSYIVHPSDLAPMLVALDAVVSIQGPDGARYLQLEKFFTLPSEGSVRKENVLTSGEIVTAVRLPIQPLTRRSTYVKFKERPSLDFALSSVAAAVEMDGGIVKQARLVLGGVAPIPWRVPKAEAVLIGKKMEPRTYDAVAEAALEGAKPLAKNGYKVPLTKALVRQALEQCAAMA